MSNEYELLPTESQSSKLNSTRRRGSTSYLRQKIRHLRPAQLIYVVPVCILIAVIASLRQQTTSLPEISSSLRYDASNGLVYLDTLNPSDSHPILELIERARLLNDRMEQKRRQVSSLADAVEDYRTTFGMMPPEGFDEW